MKTDNPFDQKLSLMDACPPFVWAVSGIHGPELKDAAIFVNDTLDLCSASAQAIFEEKATPETALAIYDRIMVRIESSQKGSSES